MPFNIIRDPIPRFKNGKPKKGYKYTYRYKRGRKLITDEKTIDYINKLNIAPSYQKVVIDIRPNVKIAAKSPFFSIAGPEITFRFVPISFDIM